MATEDVETVTSVTDMFTDNVTDVTTDGAGWNWDEWWWSQAPSNEKHKLEPLFRDIRTYSNLVMPWVGIALNGLVILVLVGAMGLSLILKHIHYTLLDCETLLQQLQIDSPVL